MFAHEFKDSPHKTAHKNCASLPNRMGPQLPSSLPQGAPPPHGPPDSQTGPAPLARPPAKQSNQIDTHEHDHHLYELQHIENQHVTDVSFRVLVPDPPSTLSIKARSRSQQPSRYYRTPSRSRGLLGGSGSRCFLRRGAAYYPTLIVGA